MAMPDVSHLIDRDNAADRNRRVRISFPSSPPAWACAEIMIEARLERIFVDLLPDSDRLRIVAHLWHVNKFTRGNGGWIHVGTDDVAEWRSGPILGGPTVVDDCWIEYECGEGIFLGGPIVDGRLTVYDCARGTFALTCA